MQIIKLCFVVPKVYVYFNPKAKITPGGAERQAFLLGQHLSQNTGFELHYCVSDEGQNKTEKHGNSLVHKSFKAKENKAVQFFKLLKTLKNIDADYYIFRSADLGVATAILALKYLLRKKTLYMVANSGESNFKDLASWAGKLTAATMSAAYKSTNIITVQSDEQFTDFQGFRSLKPAGVIRNIYELNNRISTNYNRKFILWVGRCNAIKQPEKFIELAKNNPDESFVMVCPPADDRAYYTEICKQIENTPNIRYIQFLTSVELRELYRQSKIYVITSSSEGMPNTMLEAMEAKCPVLSLNINPDQLLDRFQAGFCAPNNDTKLLNQYFKKLVSDKKLRQSMGKNGLNYLKECHKSDVIIEKLTQLFTPSSISDTTD